MLKWNWIEFPLFRWTPADSSLVTWPEQGDWSCSNSVSMSRKQNRILMEPVHPSRPPDEFVGLVFSGGLTLVSDCCLSRLKRWTRRLSGNYSWISDKSLPTRHPMLGFSSTCPILAMGRRIPLLAWSQIGFHWVLPIERLQTRPLLFPVLGDDHFFFLLISWCERPASHLILSWSTQSTRVVQSLSTTSSTLANDQVIGSTYR